jgi:hypothetical protein
LILGIVVIAVLGGLAIRRTRGRRT